MRICVPVLVERLLLSLTVCFVHSLPKGVPEHVLQRRFALCFLLRRSMLVQGLAECLIPMPSKLAPLPGKRSPPPAVTPRRKKSPKKIEPREVLISSERSNLTCSYTNNVCTEVVLALFHSHVLSYNCAPIYNIRSASIALLVGKSQIYAMGLLACYPRRCLATLEIVQTVFFQQ